MGQIFRSRANAIFRATLLAVTAGGLLGWVGAVVAVQTGTFSGTDRFVEQPIPFSHEHHVGGLGIGCQYCHTDVEKSAFAGFPPTETCMTCHSQIWTNAEMLQPVRESLRNEEPIRWRRVHDLPDYVYFNHSIHVAKGVACETCHGRVDQMPLMRKQQPLTMDWCLDCHRNPENYLRPKDKVFAMGWVPPKGVEPTALGRRLVSEYGIHTKQLTDCSVCHR